MTRVDSRLLKTGSHKVEVVIDLVEGWGGEAFFRIGAPSVPAAEASRAFFGREIVRSGGRRKGCEPFGGRVGMVTSGSSGVVVKNFVSGRFRGLVRVRSGGGTFG